MWILICMVHLLYHVTYVFRVNLHSTFVFNKHSKIWTNIKRKKSWIEFYRAKVHIFFFYFNLYNIYKYTCISCTEDADMRKGLTVNLWSNLPYSLLFYFCVTFYIITRIFISLRIYCYFDNNHTFCDIAVKRDHVHTCWAWALVCEF